MATQYFDTSKPFENRAPTDYEKRYSSPYSNPRSPGDNIGNDGLSVHKWSDTGNWANRNEEEQKRKQGIPTRPGDMLTNGTKYWGPAKQIGSEQLDLARQYRAQNPGSPNSFDDASASGYRTQAQADQKVADTYLKDTVAGRSMPSSVGGANMAGTTPTPAPARPVNSLGGSPTPATTPATPATPATTPASSTSLQPTVSPDLFARRDIWDPNSSPRDAGYDVPTPAATPATMSVPDMYAAMKDYEKNLPTESEARAQARIEANVSGSGALASFEKDAVNEKMAGKTYRPNAPIVGGGGGSFAEVAADSSAVQQPSQLASNTNNTYTSPLGEESIAKKKNTGSLTLENYTSPFSIV